MGALRDVDLAGIIASSGVRYLVEFGASDGDDTAYAADFPFDHIYSIEPSHRLAIQGAFRHSANQKMTFIHGKGERGWRQAAPEIPGEIPVLFLLDGASLEADLAAIRQHRDIRHDVLLIEEGDPLLLERLLGATHRLDMPAAGMLRASPAS